MSTRRIPLSSNANAANSPVRSHASALDSVLSKHRQAKRPFAATPRDDPFVQPPAAKKKLLNDGTSQAQRSPVHHIKVSKRETTRPHKEERVAQAHASTKAAQHEEEDAKMRRWKEVTRRNFPTFVFYFESCPSELRPKLVKQLNQLGAREEKFFSKDITHVITTRSIPTERPLQAHADDASVSAQTQRGHHEMPRTIDPSLLSRDSGPKDIRRRLLESTKKVNVVPALGDAAPKQTVSSRHSDILIRALEMNKKIWALNKLQRVFEVMFDTDPCGTGTSAPKPKDDATNLAQLLNRERTSGPSDRDPTVVTKELIYFKGPYIYVYDIEEKQKPIMVREYPKVANKKEGEWPQFRSTSDGRCPFVEDEDYNERKRQQEKQKAREKERETEREREREKLKKAETAPEFKAPPVPVKKQTAEVDENSSRPDHNNVKPPTFESARTNQLRATEICRPEHAFTSRAKAARLWGGEPVASGMQASNITSAIRSQMISSATGILGAKAGTSKELHGLQRKVLQKSNATSTNATSQDLSSRRLVEMSIEPATGQRPASAGNNTQRKAGSAEGEKVTEHKRTVSVPATLPDPKPKRRVLKPGYCENCQDKFKDFEEHITSRKHRKFAENDRNWSQLDSLLEKLSRVPKYADNMSGRA
ncbi:Dfp1/Him1, central region-domain-containing protein [Coniella lustricola]|uniref:Dfp1/Him1, central region-domain-containing protein n=1 Tax=Coniella lustricola TaxID=2025994 RepID=A0A2T3AI39_9PEZI|nr:Dfp1/Him1, central region-domain-containing protein [Coniella lustricola]